MSPSVWPAPEPGDIVWCRFPQGPSDLPGPKNRPALVIAVGEREDGHFVQAAYGTSQKLNRIYPGEFSIVKSENLQSYKAAGLSYDTKFNLRNFVFLPWGPLFFQVAPGQRFGNSPKLGALQGIAIKKFHGAATRVQLGAGDIHRNQR